MVDPDILIIGSGAMACFFAARLAAAGLHVCMVDDWVEGIQAVRQNGITLDINNQLTKQNIQTCLPGEIIPQCQTALLLVKSWQTEWAADQLNNCLTPNGIAITLQNGLGNDLILRNRLGNQRVAVGVTTLGATLVSPGQVKGFEDGGISLENKPGIENIISILQKARFAASLDTSIERIIWGKLIINAAINPLTALLGISNGKLLDIPFALDLMGHIATEAAGVADHLQIRLKYKDPMQQIIQVINATALNYSSMYQDLQRGAPTEIDQINGAISRLGMTNGIQTPYNLCVTALVKSRVSINSSR